MKKVLAVVTVVCVMFAAGTALAQQRPNEGHRPQAPQRMEQHHRPHRGNFTPDMPKEIREKATELAKLRIDLEEAMTSRPLNKEKALEVHAKMQKVEQEVEAWRFAQRLERIEEMQKQRELNRTIPPARTETATD